MADKKDTEQTVSKEDEHLRHLWAVCVPWNCPYLSKQEYKMYCYKEDDIGRNPSRELMLDCALRYNWHRAEEFNRFKQKERLAVAEPFKRTYQASDSLKMKINSTPDYCFDLMGRCFKEPHEVQAVEILTCYRKQEKILGIPKNIITVELKLFEPLKEEFREGQFDIAMCATNEYGRWSKQCYHDLTVIRIKGLEVNCVAQGILPWRVLDGNI